MGPGAKIRVLRLENRMNSEELSKRAGVGSGSALAVKK